MAEVEYFAGYPVYSLNNLPSKEATYNQGALFLIDKPRGWTSFKVVYVLRKLIQVKKVGHAGTLDPLATGLLILCAGKATKTISKIQELPKRYLAGIRFGASTPSYDADTEVDNRASWDHITREQIEEVLKLYFNGTIRQIPPMYSALKKNGKRLYTLARQGKTVEREPREVTIYQTLIESFQSPDLKLNVQCSKGTYVRTLADDLGKKLDSLAHLTDRRRMSIGTYSVEKALSISKLEEVFET